MSRIKAYKTHTAAGGTLDHTYVCAEKASDKENKTGAGVTVEHRWGCFGGNKNGVEVKQASGKGSVSTAKKIAGKDGGKGNGIGYAINGVCHTMSNRIMCESRKTVNKDVRGGTASMLAYGYYGVRVPAGAAAGIGGYIVASLKAGRDWKQRCKNAGVNWNPLMKAPDADRDDEDAAFQGVLSAYMNLDDASKLSEMALAEANYVLADALGDERAAQLAPQMAEIVMEMSEGAGAFRAGVQQDRPLRTMDMTELAATLNEPIVLMQQQHGKLLTSDEFRTVFGTAPDDPVVLIEPDVLAAVYGSVDAYLDAVEKAGTPE